MEGYPQKVEPIHKKTEENNTRENNTRENNTSINSDGDISKIFQLITKEIEIIQSPLKITRVRR